MDEFSFPNPPSHTAFPVAEAGYSYIFAAVFATAVFALLELTVLALLGLCITFFICYFFRDPDRIIPQKKGAFVSPADGKIIWAGQTDDRRFYDGRCMKISIFMNVFNVHVNRIPHEGRVKKVNYYPGKFFSANLDKASKDNEHNAVFFETEDGRNICVVQIAGLIARRIICKIQADEQVVRGQRFGLICFGSRVDIYVPPDTTINVNTGDKVAAGTTVLGELP